MKQVAMLWDALWEGHVYRKQKSPVTIQSWQTDTLVQGTEWARKEVNPLQARCEMAVACETQSQRSQLSQAWTPNLQKLSW